MASAHLTPASNCETLCAHMQALAPEPAASSFCTVDETPPPGRLKQVRLNYHRLLAARYDTPNEMPSLWWYTAGIGLQVMEVQLALQNCL